MAKSRYYYNYGLPNPDAADKETMLPEVQGRMPNYSHPLSSSASSSSATAPRQHLPDQLPVVQEWFKSPFAQYSRFPSSYLSPDRAIQKPRASPLVNRLVEARARGSDLGTQESFRGNVASGMTFQGPNNALNRMPSYKHTGGYAASAAGIERGQAPLPPGAHDSERLVTRGLTHNFLRDNRIAPHEVPDPYALTRVPPSQAGSAINDNFYLWSDPRIANSYRDFFNQSNVGFSLASERPFCGDCENNLGEFLPEGSEGYHIWVEQGAPERKSQKFNQRWEIEKTMPMHRATVEQFGSPADLTRERFLPGVFADSPSSSSSWGAASASSALPSPAPWGSSSSRQ